MNAVALRTERALADWLSAQDWSASLIGTPTCLTSYGHGAFSDPDLEDRMPDFPRIVIKSINATPVFPTDRSCEIDISVTLQVSADDSSEPAILSIVQIFDNLLQYLCKEGNASSLNADDADLSGAFTAMFVLPSDFGSSDTSDRARTFSRSLTIFAAANTQP